MGVTHYIELFRTGSDRNDGILISLLLLVAETKIIKTAAYVINSHLANMIDKNLKENRLSRHAKAALVRPINKKKIRTKSKRDQTLF